MSVTPIGSNLGSFPKAVSPPAKPATAGPLVAAPADRVERSLPPAGPPVRGLGVGLVAGAAAEAGLGIGAGATASAGAGLFIDPGKGIKPGAFASAGSFAGKGALGAFAGAGFGAFVTNAGSAQQLAGVAQTHSLNVGVGPLKISLQVGNADGTYAASLSVGPGLGLDVSSYPTDTVTTKQ